MKLNFTALLLLATATSSFAQFKYINPLPESSYRNPQTNIILFNGNFIDISSIADAGLLEIYGSQSGQHEWKARLSDDDKTIIVKPIVGFDWGETVFVIVHDKIRTTTGSYITGTQFSFKIRDEITPEQMERYRQSDREIFRESFGFDPEEEIEYPLDSMPTFTINVNNNPAPGRIFYCNQQELDEDDTNSFPTIIENDGAIVWARDLGKDGHDFKINNNGYLTYFQYGNVKWMIMDSNFNVIDSIQCGNGYEMETNGHDMVMYPNGHAFVIAYNSQTMDLTAIGGKPDATVKGGIIQELDKKKDVIFEWRTWDHFEITDAVSTYPLFTNTVDYCHINSVERDYDGNIMISSRYLCELTKIDRQTGDIIWRMGGENNQFTFENDNIPEHFSYQHDLRRLPNGNISILNNGNFLPVQVSSAKEYAIDEMNKVATLIWYYEHPDVGNEKVYGRASGNAQKLPNGNWMISWGTIFWEKGIPSMSEVNQNKEVVWEMTFDTAGQKSYRTHKYEWNPCSRITSYTMDVNVSGLQTVLAWQPATGAKSYQVDYRKLGSNKWKTVHTQKTKHKLTGLTAGAKYEWRVKSICSQNPSVTSAYSFADTFVNAFKTTPDDLNQPLDIVAFPVPASDQLNIVVGTSSISKVIVYNISGKIMYERKYDSELKQQVEINTLQWPSGIYLVELQADKALKTVKVVKL